MKIKSQTHRDPTTVKKKKTNKMFTEKKDTINFGSIITPNSGGISKKKQKNSLKKEKINLNGVSKLEDNTAGELIKLSLASNKIEDNPVHPIFLKHRRNNEEQISNVTVPMDTFISTGKQSNKKNKTKKLEIIPEVNDEAVSNNTKQKNKTQGADKKPNNTESSGKFNMKIQFKKNNRKRKAKGVKAQTDTNDETDSLRSPKTTESSVNEDFSKPVENDSSPNKKRKRNRNKKLKKSGEDQQQNSTDAETTAKNSSESPKPANNETTPNKKRQRNRNKKLKKSVEVKQQSNIDGEIAKTNLPVSLKPPYSNVNADSTTSAEKETTPNKKQKRNRNKKLKKSVEVKQQSNIDGETSITNLPVSSKPPYSNVNADSTTSAEKDTTPNKKQKRNRNKKLKKSIDDKQQSNRDGETILTNSPVSPKAPYSDVNADSSTSAENDTTPNEKQKRNRNKKLKLEQNQSESTETSDEDVTIFVGNLPIDVEKKDVENLFKSYGKIQSIRLRSAASSDQRIPKKVAVITQDFHKDVSSINAFVVFKEKFEARNALIVNGSVYKGHHIRVDYAKSKQKNNKIGIFVGNLPFNVKDDDLWETFKNCGEIESVRVIRDKDTRMGKGFGYVNFKSADGVELALQLEDVTIQNRKLRIARPADPKAGKQGSNSNKPVKRKFSMSNSNNNDDSFVEKKKMKREISELSENDDSQNLKKKKFQGEKSAAHKLKKQTFKKKVKKIRNEKHKKSIASLLTSTSRKGLMSKE